MKNQITGFGKIYAKEKSYLMEYLNYHAYKGLTPTIRVAEIHDGIEIIHAYTYDDPFYGRITDYVIAVFDKSDCECKIYECESSDEAYPRVVVTTANDPLKFELRTLCENEIMTNIAAPALDGKEPVKIHDFKIPENMLEWAQEKCLQEAKKVHARRHFIVFQYLPAWENKVRGMMKKRDDFIADFVAKQETTQRQGTNGIIGTVIPFKQKLFRDK
jgi:endo-beta-N-acetylglucosaminidase D